MPLNHLNLNVSDLERSVRFYRAAFGMDEIERHPDFVVLQTPGYDDVLTLRQASDDRPPGLDHLGFFSHLADDFGATVARVEAAGGRLISQDRDADPPGAFFADPDGFSVQI